MEIVVDASERAVAELKALAPDEMEMSMLSEHQTLAEIDLLSWTLARALAISKTSEVLQAQAIHLYKPTTVSFLLLSTSLIITNHHPFLKYCQSQAESPQAPS